jgi:hypothetical protein
MQVAFGKHWIPSNPSLHVGIDHGTTSTTDHLARWFLSPPKQPDEAPVSKNKIGVATELLQPAVRPENNPEALSHFHPQNTNNPLPTSKDLFGKPSKAGKDKKARKTRVLVKTSFSK